MVSVVILKPFQFSYLFSANLGDILSWLNWRTDSLPESVIVSFGTSEDENNIYIYFAQAPQDINLQIQLSSRYCYDFFMDQQADEIWWSYISRPKMYKKTHIE